MQLECIISLANKTMELQLNVMVRSLRNVGCDLPVRVIPYDENTFDLPPGCEWWSHPELNEWLATNGITPRRRKFQALLASNYQFADPDIVFLRDPAQALAAHSGFIATDTEWSRTGFTESLGPEEALDVLAAQTSVWRLRLFNSGQFACEPALYTLDSLIEAASAPGARAACMASNRHDQLAMNVLVAKSGAPITNLTQPPWHMESTWAGEYPAGYEQYWKNPETKPYLIHWAGLRYFEETPINQLFEDYLTREERVAWEEKKAKFRSAHEAKVAWPFLVRVNNFFLRKLYPNFCIAGTGVMHTEDLKKL